MEHDGVALEGGCLDLESAWLEKKWNLGVGNGATARLEVEAGALRCFGLEEESWTWFGQLGCRAQFFFYLCGAK